MKAPRVAYHPLAACLAALLAIPAFALPAAFSVPFAPNGDGAKGSNGVPIPLSPTSYLCAAEGPDGAFDTADDVVLFVSHLDTTPEVEPISAPYMPDGSGRPIRLSATRALVLSAGVDGNFSTPDDAVILLDHLGSDNTAQSIVVGPIDDSDGFSPVALSSTSAVLATYGTDQTADTADDTVALLSGLGTTNTVTPLAAPHLLDRRSRPAALSPTAFLVPSDGPDGAKHTADDQVYFFHASGGTFGRTDLATPHLAEFSPRTPVRISATRAVVASYGPDGVLRSADDELLLLDDLGATNTITPIAVPFLHAFSCGSALPLANDLLVVGSVGPDGQRASADDRLDVITGVGTTNTVTPVTVGGVDEDLSSRATRLSPTRVAFCTGGPTFGINTLDDEVAVVSNIGTTNDLDRIPVPGLSGASSSIPLPLSVSSFLISNGGPNGSLDTGLDDKITLVSGLGGMVTSTPLAADGELNTQVSSAVQGLGGGRAVCVSSGANGTVGTGDDDQMRVVTGLPTTRGLHVTKLNVTFDPHKPNAVETFSASGAYNTDDKLLHAGSDLTVSIGNASQTIPAARIKQKASGQLTYSDPKHKSGFISNLTLNPTAHKFSIVARGKGTGIRTTDAAYAPVAIEGANAYFSDLPGSVRSVQKGLRFP